MHGERGHARRTWTQQQAYRSVEPEGCCGSKKLASFGDISPHRQGPRSMTLGYVSLAESSQHSPRATLCRYSVAGPADGKMRTRPEMLCTTIHQRLSERGLSRNARRTWTQQQAYSSVEPEGCCGSKELARGGDISPHRQVPRSMTLGYVSLAGSSQHSPRATICRFSVAGPVGCQSSNAAH